MPYDPHLSQTEAATLVRISDQLTTALRSVVESPPLRGLGPIELARTVGVDKTLASRLMTALRAGDPLIALSALPGVPPLRQFIHAARERGVPAAAADAAEAELAAFSAELQRTFGTRTNLDAVIADSLPEARRRHQENARQSVFRGMALVKGVSIDLTSVTWVVHPSRERPGRVDILVLAACIGVRRLRPSSCVRFTATHSRSKPQEHARLLTPFCRPAGLAIRTTVDGPLTVYEIATGPLTRDAAADVFLTETIPGAAPIASPTEGPATFTLGDSIDHPYKKLVLNLIIHESAWPDCDFDLRALDTAARGRGRLADHSWEGDLLPLDATLVRSAATPEALRRSPVPQYAAALEHLVTPLGWDISRARMFSTEVVYPVYGSQIVLIHRRG